MGTYSGWSITANTIIIKASWNVADVGYNKKMLSSVYLFHIIKFRVIISVSYVSQATPVSGKLLIIDEYAVS